MAGRKSNTRLDRALELWARWSWPESAGFGSKSMLAKLIDNKGELFFGGSASVSGPVDCLESMIEAAVLSMFVASPLRADVLRLEYGANWWAVVIRRDISGYEQEGIGQFEKSEALGMSLRTYRRRLAEARETIQTLLGIT